MIWTLYDIMTGRYVRYVEGPDELNVNLNVRPGQMKIKGEYPRNSYLVGDEIRLMPDAPPGDHWRFDIPSEQWVDPRSAEDRQEAIYAARAATQIDKAELLNRMLVDGRFSSEDFRIASRGDVPPALQPILDEMTETARLIAENKWRNDMVISRMNPVILLMAHAMNLTPEDMDALFGVVLPT